MRLVVEKKWSELHTVWRELEETNILTSPFQSYEFLTFTKKGKPYYKDPFRLVGLKELNLVLYSDNEAIIIAPLLIKKVKKRYNVYLRGRFTGALYLDFIYNPKISYDDFVFFMDSIKKRLGNVCFDLDRISDSSLICQYSKEYFASGEIEKHECVHIPIAQNYDDWYGNLHKSVFRNMAQYTNRLKKDQIKWSVEFHYKEEIDHKTFKNMMRVFADRFISKNHMNLGPLNRILKIIILHFLMIDKMTQWINKANNNFHAILYMNDEIAGFSNGLICKNGQIAGCRLAISNKYKRYSPGMFLICGVIKNIIEQNKSGKMKIDRLDMASGGGGGMSYKYTYGGVTHYYYNFKNLK